jgi:thiol-disulfide isomerase/thioredoxin
MIVSNQSQAGGGMLSTQSDIVDRAQGVYEVYAPEKIARAEIGPVVLFFHASWCPSCRRLNADIEKNSTLIPDGVTLLKVDYDTSTNLKKKYGVTTQHTLVQVDPEGNLIKKWTGSSQLSKLISEIQ